MGLSMFDEHDPVMAVVALTIADTTVPAYLTQGASRGTRLDDLLLTSDAAGAVDVHLVLDNGTAYVVATVSVPSGAGLVGGIPPKSVSSLFPVGQDALVVPGGTTVKVAMAVTLGAGETVTAFAFGGNY